MSGPQTNSTGDGAKKAFDREMLLFEEWREQFERDGEAPAIPAATVVVLRDGPEGVESLMLRKNSRIAFGGMWVFPGGRIDDDDYDSSRNMITAARNAAAREAGEIELGGGCDLTRRSAPGSRPGALLLLDAPADRAKALRDVVLRGSGTR